MGDIIDFVYYSIYKKLYIFYKNFIIYYRYDICFELNKN